MNRTVIYQGAFSRIVGFADKRFLFSPPPSIFFCFGSRSNFRALTRLETLATQASQVSEVGQDTQATQDTQETQLRQARQVSEVGQDSQATQDTQVLQVPRYTI